MRRYFFTLVVLLLTFRLLAQNDMVITGSKKISKDLTPKQVVDSLNKRFPDAKSVEYYQPAHGVAKGWEVEKEDNLEGQGIDYYEVSFKNSNINYYALYQADGTLVKSRMQQSEADLPEPIKAHIKSLSKEHPGYTLVSKKYYKNQNYTKSKEYYEVIAKKDKVKKTLYYSPDGTLVKIK